MSKANLNTTGYSCELLLNKMTSKGSDIDSLEQGLLRRKK